VKRALIVADLPFMTFQISAEQALANAGRMIQEGGAHAVKLEGGERSAEAIRKIVQAGIPVMAHIGMTPQSVRAFGGFRVQRDESQILADAQAVADAGAFSVVLECIPAELAAKVTAALSIPTIGIGAGADCDGQVLVLHDVLGLFDDLKPKFVKRYAELGSAIRDAVKRYCDDVRAGTFPGPEHGFR
jgi:3-methyl-2-oxobutanoate hydroxymethyltransferase